jgi:outer membrane protein OmpA-like peptidoglycan-associated protein/tetratricopeptide (TPR) repeat protein
MVRKYLIVFFCVAYSQLFLIKSSYAQDGDKETAKMLVSMADEILKVTSAVNDARDQYKMAAEMDPENIKANYMTGKLYLETIDKHKASPYLLQVLELDPNYQFDIAFQIGRGYQYGLDFDKALFYYEKYKENIKANPNYRGKDKVSLAEVERKIFECKNGKEFVSAPGNYSIVNVGTTINSEFPDYGPVLNEDETLMVFTSRRQEDNLNENVDNDNFPFEDIFYSEKVDGKWTSAKNMGTNVNNPYHESSLALSADGQQLYIYKDDNGGDIYFSELKDKVWTVPKPLSDNINSSYAEKSISISPNKSILFFSSDRPGGYGGIDIYMAKKDSKGNWGKSINLGPEINTEYDDEAPFIDYDGKTLYFSTRGRKGIGGHDIFKSVYDSLAEGWTKPINLGYPINTPDDDIFYVSTKNKNRSYYASVRGDGKGYLDIYMITANDSDPNMAKKTPEPVEEKIVEEIIEEKVVEQIPQEPRPKTPQEEPELQAKIEANESTLDNKSQNDRDNARKQQTDPYENYFAVKLIIEVEGYEDSKGLDAKVNFRTSGDNIIAPVKKISLGKYEIEVKHRKNKDYMLSVEKEGYMFKNFKITVPAAKEKEQIITRKIEMERLTKGYKTVLRNIYFDFSRASFTIESYAELNKLEQMLFENKNLFVEISGHTDNIGAKEYNKNLSKKRAEAVVDFLTNKGIDPRRLSSQGYGQERPMATNDDEKDGRELNRRVEFKVLEVKSQD